ncbi:MAG TPA: type II toxin-antitoxin system prevent-host-death family antitoxin [Candidatus Baltobacteraceae bacterium]|nr:type II toxin-antitoxin system prevent-host-death family antitoxin [Candidatus Baltobacteraceae bacterium]
MTRKSKPDKAPKPVSLLMLGSREIAASEFKARCLEIMDEVQRTGAEVVITKHRKPIARLVPAQPRTGSIIGSMKGMILWMGDVVSPTGELWEGDESNLT